MIIGIVFQILIVNYRADFLPVWAQTIVRDNLRSLALQTAESFGVFERLKMSGEFGLGK